jgi:hypothetical protein
MKMAMLHKGLFILFCFISLAGFSQKEAMKLKPQQLSPDLQQLLEQKGTDSVELLVTIKDKQKAFSHNQKFRIIEQYAPANILKIKAKTDDLEAVLLGIDPYFANLARKPIEELISGSLDISLNKLNYLHVKYPELNGAGIVLSIKEQQFDTTDIDYINRYIDSKRSAPGMTAHASIMATIAAGAGNSSPYAEGAAPGAMLTSSDFASLLPDPDSVYRKYNISVQNHSYGTAVDNIYGNEAFAYDVSTVNNPYLLPVFSSGNSGDTSATTGIYAGIKGLSNLTGNFKQAKNILTVGAVDSFNNVDIRSSKGPAFDGRVKPEVVAFGQDGSSGAAALVSGAVALVQHAYMLNHNGTLPDAALVKAILINSADDIGSPYVDYSSGYGNLNAWKAVAAVLNNHFYQTSVSHQETKSFQVNVPPNISQLKVTVAWTDVPALPNVPKALVNDIDASVRSESTYETWLPWVLSSIAHADSLKKPAIRKLDTLNNVEQITIENPTPGSYLLQVKGSRITNERQLVYAAIQFDTAGSFMWTFPAKDDLLVAGVNNVLRWQSNLSATGKIEYSVDGTNWQSITDNVSLKGEFFHWQTPDIMDKAILRLSVNAIPPVVSDTFIITRQSDINVGFNCADSFMLSWAPLPGITRYQLYQLGNKYLEPFAVVDDTSVLLKKALYPSLYYAVAPVVEQAEGLKSYTVNYTTAGIDCYFKGFYIQEKADSYVLLRADLGSLYNVTGITLQKQSGNEFIDISATANPNSLSYLFSDSSLGQGIQYYRVLLTLANGNTTYSEIIPVIHFTSLPVFVFPNPTPQNSPINVLTQEPGRYLIEIVDIQGQKIKEYRLLDGEQKLPSFILSKGIYFMRIRSEGGKVGVQKLVVY